MLLWTPTPTAPMPLTVPINSRHKKVVLHRAQYINLIMRVAVCVTVYIDIEPWLHELVRLVRRGGVCSDYCPTRPHCWLYWQNEPQIKAGVPVSISGWDSRNTVGYCGNCGYCGGLETSRRVDITSSTGQAMAQLF